MDRPCCGGGCWDGGAPDPGPGEQVDVGGGARAPRVTAVWSESEGRLPRREDPDCGDRFPSEGDASPWRCCAGGSSPGGNKNADAGGPPVEEDPADHIIFFFGELCGL